MATGQTSALMAIRDPDIRLMLRVRDQSDQSAFTELVDRYQRRVLALMHHMTGRPDEAEDLAQEVFLRIYQSRSRYTPKAKFSTWLFAIANNLAQNANRSRNHARQVYLIGSGSQLDRPALSNKIKQTDTANQDVQREELAAVIREALNQLSPRQRMALLLNKYEDMPYAEIAQVMGLSESAIKSLLCRARVKLRDQLKGYLNYDLDENEPQQSRNAPVDSER